MAVLTGLMSFEVVASGSFLHYREIACFGFGGTTATTTDRGFRVGRVGSLLAELTDLEDVRGLLRCCSLEVRTSLWEELVGKSPCSFATTS